MTRVMHITAVLLNARIIASFVDSPCSFAFLVNLLEMCVHGLDFYHYVLIIMHVFSMLAACLILFVRLFFSLSLYDMTTVLSVFKESDFYGSNFS